MARKLVPAASFADVLNEMAQENGQQNHFCFPEIHADFSEQIKKFKVGVDRLLQI